MCAHPFKAELFLQVFDTKNVYKFSIALFKKMKIDSRKKREEIFLCIGLSDPTQLAYSILTIFLHSIQRSGLNNSSGFGHFQTGKTVFAFIFVCFLVE